MSICAIQGNTASVRFLDHHHQQQLLCTAAVRTVYVHRKLTVHGKKYSRPYRDKFTVTFKLTFQDKDSVLIYLKVD